MDTIFALSSAPGKAGVAMIRISGPGVKFICGELTGGFIPEVRRSSLRSLHAPDGSFLDEALLLRFEANKSFTGEEVLELHIHGSTAVIEAVLKCLASFPQTRIAEPGEFTRRALENGRLDLTQIDGLADLIQAETQAQKRQAERLFQGQLGQAVSTWRSDLIGAAALMQATIDFSDEEIPENLLPEIQQNIENVRKSLALQLSGSSGAEIIRDGFEVAIVGEPNIGKSTLLNYLAGREAAITSSVAGTTRDVIEVRMNIAGYTVVFLDTAGIRDSGDEIEMIGIQKGLSRASSADLRLVLVRSVESELPLKTTENDIICVAKMDEPRDDQLGVSGITGYGISDLLEILEDRLSRVTMGSSLMVRDRHRNAVETALVCLAGAISELACNDARLELVAEDLRRASHALDTIVGKIGIEDILDEVFSNFCLGK